MTTDGSEFRRRWRWPRRYSAVRKALENHNTHSLLQTLARDAFLGSKQKEARDSGLQENLFGPEVDTRCCCNAFVLSAQHLLLTSNGNTSPSLLQKNVPQSSLAHLPGYGWTCQAPGHDIGLRYWMHGSILTHVDYCLPLRLFSWTSSSPVGSDD